MQRVVLLVVESLLVMSRFWVCYHAYETIWIKASLYLLIAAKEAREKHFTEACVVTAYCARHRRIADFSFLNG